jgi:ribose transport system ATP-binding protein
MLLSAVRRYASLGQTIVLVSHRVDEVLSVADAVTVLRDGRHIVTCPTAGLTEGSVVEYIVGRKLDRFYPTSGAMDHEGVEVCRVEGLRGGPIGDVSFALRPGEILGLAGLLGSGRTELLRMLFGADRCDAGTIAIDGRQIAVGSPSDAMRAGVAYVPEDRAAQAAFMSMSVRENLTMAYLDRYGAYGRIDKRRERARARALVTQFMVRTPSEQEGLSALSGGNQQKVVLGRWLHGAPRLLLLDEPTQGVDVGARADLYRMVRDAVDAGAAALVVSSDFDELANLADRVLVLAGGHVRAELRAPIDGHRLTELAHQQ